MYKVIKNGIDTSSYKAEFAAIRYGDYMEFLNAKKKVNGEA